MPHFEKPYLDQLTKKTARKEITFEKRPGLILLHQKHKGRADFAES